MESRDMLCGMMKSAAAAVMAAAVLPSVAEPNSTLQVGASGLPNVYTTAADSGAEWTGGSATSDNWSDSDNWNGGIKPTATSLVTFDGANRLTPFNDSMSTLSGLVFRASAGAFTLTGAGSANRLELTANCHSRGTATPEKANIVSHSGSLQTIAVPLSFPLCAYVHSDGGAEVMLKNGFCQASAAQSTQYYFIAGGEVAIGGDCSATKLGFRTAATSRSESSLLRT